MSLSRFLESLFSDGRVFVAAVTSRTGTTPNFASEELQEALEFLIGFEREYRLELPGSPPAVSSDAMLWSAQTVYRACSLLAHRDADESAVRRLMNERCPADPTTPATHYSVDLSLRFLPDLIRLARAASPTDPLVEELIMLAKQWPLSSVGIADVGEVDVSGFLSDTSLRQIYLDRVLAADDSSRLNNAVVNEGVRIAIGRHAELAGKRIKLSLASD